jgi:hypothetical protein
MEFNEKSEARKATSLAFVHYIPTGLVDHLGDLPLICQIFPQSSIIDQR